MGVRSGELKDCYPATDFFFFSLDSWALGLLWALAFRPVTDCIPFASKATSLELIAW